ncbi:MAG: hypothetical protein LCH73_09365 [Proteobacteria bacterium]|nr:hypothetical protein [Pseudomonadota bacterium]
MFKSTPKTAQPAWHNRQPKHPPAAPGAPAQAGGGSRLTAPPSRRPNDELPCWPLYALWHPQAPW